MKTDPELESMLDRLRQEIERLRTAARAGEKARAELAHFRQSFGLAPDVDLVVEFDRRGERDTRVIQELQARLRTRETDLIIFFPSGTFNG